MTKESSRSKSMLSVAVSLACCALILAGTGCATVISGDLQTVSIDSNPSGAKIRVGSVTATTPASVELRRNELYTVVLSKEGYQTQKINLEQGINPTWWVNLLWVPPICLLPMEYDMYTGAAYSLKPADIATTLLPATAGSDGQPDIIPVGNVSAPRHDPAMARICVICPYKDSGIYHLSCRVSDGDDVIATLGQNSYLCWERKPGQVTIRCTNYKLTEFTAAAGRTYYLPLGRNMSLVNETEAAEKLKNCKPMPLNDYIISQN